jgi:hypothetical protein
MQSQYCTNCWHLLLLLKSFRAEDVQNLLYAPSKGLLMHEHRKEMKPMTEPIRQSAQIYRFPIGGRGGVVVYDQAKPAPDARLQRVANTTFGGAWYHDAAIQDASCPSER